MHTNDDLERFVEACSVQVGNSAVLRSLGMLVSLVGGEGWYYNPFTGSGQLGVTGGVGLHNIGLLVRLVGTVTCSDPVGRYFDIWNGSMRYQDICGDLGLRIDCLGRFGQIPTAGKFVSVTGVVSCFRFGSYLSPRILPTEIIVLGP